MKFRGAHTPSRAVFHALVENTVIQCAASPIKNVATAIARKLFGETPKRTRGTRMLPSSFKFQLSGFTLTELLVSMTILSGLILLLFSVVDGTTQVWNKSEQRVDSFREARAALFIIARDLQTMVPAPTPTPTTTVPAPTPSFRYFFINPERIGTTDVTFSGIAEDAYADRLFFLTAQPSGAQTSTAKSDVCAVGYYLDYTAAANAMTTIPTFKLYRYFKDSDSTFNSLKPYIATPPTSTVLMQANSTTDEILARNVVDFRIVAYDKDFKKIDPVLTATDYGRVTPYAIDLSITAYNYSAANRFSKEADWTAGAANTSSRQTFTTRVYLPRH